MATLIAATTLPASAAPIHLVNIMPSFFALWPAGKTPPLREQLHSFKKNVISPNQPVYGPKYVALDDRNLAWYLQSMRPRIASMRKTSAMLQQQLPALEASFELAFPKFDPASAQIYLMPSMMTFDGMTTDIGAKHTILVGIDALAAERDTIGIKLGILVDHEMFHMYHHAINPAFFATPSENDLYRYGLYRELWAEGLATYVSQKLNPDASEADALISKTLAGLPAYDLRKLACLVQEDLDSRSSAQSALFFDEGRHPRGLPSRGGYYIGYLVAEQLGKHRSLSALADLHGDSLRTQIKNTVRLMCSKQAP